MIFQSLIRGTLLLAAGTLMSQVVLFPNLLPLVGALLAWAVILGLLNWMSGFPALCVTESVTLPRGSWTNIAVHKGGPRI